MRKTLATTLLCLALATGLLCAGCNRSSADDTYTEEVLALAGTEFDATVTGYEIENEGAIEEQLTIDYEFSFEREDGETASTTWEVWYTVEDEPDYDDVIEYADSEVDVTCEDGTAASMGDISNGSHITVVHDEEGLPETIVIMDD